MLGTGDEAKMPALGYVPNLSSRGDCFDSHAGLKGPTSEPPRRRGHSNSYRKRNRGLNEDWRGGPGATGPKEVRAQILLDRARFSPGEIDGVYGDDFGIAVKGY